MIGFIALLASAPVFGQLTSCVSTPFCGRKNDCCIAHSECFSMCCSAYGHCLEPKYCFNSLQRAFSELRGEPPTKRLQPATNSTQDPLVPGNVETKFCFQYTDMNSTSTEKFEVTQD